ncbi:MAG: RNA polymerase sigma factor, partial [Pseudomonadota bacterium]
AGQDDEGRRLEQGDLVHHALSRLSPEHRLVIELSYFQGNSYQEIAAIAGCPENTVKTRVFHARRRLQNIMQDLGEAPAGGH